MARRVSFFTDGMPGGTSNETFHLGSPAPFSNRCLARLRILAFWQGSFSLNRRNLKSRLRHSCRGDPGGATTCLQNPRKC